MIVVIVFTARDVSSTLERVDSLKRVGIFSQLLTFDKEPALNPVMHSGMYSVMGHFVDYSLHFSFKESQRKQTTLLLGQL